MSHHKAVAIFTLLACLSPALADDGRETLEYEIDASVDAVWQAFTTTRGLQSWVAPLAEIDLRVGGKWRSNYNPEGVLGDATTIENTILSYDPGHMLSLQTTTFPQGFPFEEAARGTWTVFYFTPLGENRTRIRVVGLGYDDSEQSRRMRSFFKAANEYSLQQLAAALQVKGR